MTDRNGFAPPELSRILLATDFSMAGRAAFQAAVQLCLSSGACLSILHVFEYGSLATPEVGGQLLDFDRFYRDAETSMDGLVQDARQRGVCCEGKIGSGAADAAIVGAACEEDTQLVVLGTRAIHGFERLVFGSTAEAVLRHAACPVYTVGPQAACKDPQAVPARGIVVFATDFHDKTTEALTAAVRFAHLLKLPLHCLHVLPRTTADGTHKGSIPTIITEALQHLAEKAELGPAAPVCSVTYGSEISNAIVEYAKQHNALLIVLGVRRASLIASHVPAHIAYRIITEAPCPVLTMAFPLKTPEMDALLELIPEKAELPGSSFVPWGT